MPSTYRDPQSWLSLRDRIAGILYDDESLIDRFKSVAAAVQKIGPRATQVEPELASMRRAAQENREKPFLLVGREILVWCQQQYRAAAIEFDEYDPAEEEQQPEEHDEEEYTDEDSCDDGEPVEAQPETLTSPVDRLRPVTREDILRAIRGGRRDT